MVKKIINIGESEIPLDGIKDLESMLKKFK